MKTKYHLITGAALIASFLYSCLDNNKKNKSETSDPRIQTDTLMNYGHHASDRTTTAAERNPLPGDTATGKK